MRTELGKPSLRLALQRAGVARGAEFRIDAPVRPARVVGQLAPETLQQAEVVGHAGERPGRVELVGRLVVGVLVVRLAAGLARRGATVDPVLARAERERRHATLGEAE